MAAARGLIVQPPGTVSHKCKTGVVVSVRYLLVHRLDWENPNL